MKPGQILVVVAQDVLHEKRATRAEHARDLAHRRQQGGEVVGRDPAGHGAEAARPEGQGLHVAGEEPYPGGSLPRREVARRLQHR